MAQVLTAPAVSAPFEFQPSTAQSDVPDFLDANWDRVNSESNTIIDLPGRDINYVTDTLIAAAKFFHVVDCARSQVSRGAMTWAIVDSYHAALIGARLVSAMFGVLSYSVRGRTILVDFRPELGSVDDVKSFRKAAKGLNEPIRILCPQPKYLEQADAWALVVRLCTIAEKDSAPEDVAILEALRATAGEKVSAFRNAMLYDSISWEWPDDLSGTAASQKRKLERLKDDAGAQSLTLRALSEMFAIGKAGIQKLGAEVGFNPNVLSPSFARSKDPASLLG